MSARFSGLNPKVPYLSYRKRKQNYVVLTYFIKRGRKIWNFYVAVVQQRLRKCASQMRCTCKVFFFFCCSPSPLQKLPIVVIQGFCYHGNRTSHLSSLFLRSNKIMVYDPLKCFFCNACTFFTTSFPCFVIWKLKKKQTHFSLSETKPSEDCIVPVKLNKSVLIRNQHFSDPERDIRCFILAKYL